jgi:hypothetical protein
VAVSIMRQQTDAAPAVAVAFQRSKKITVFVYFGI